MTSDTLQNKKRPVRILLIEDNHGDALLVLHALKQSHIKNQITIAGSGEEALNLLKKHSEQCGSPQMPDIILLDLNLPGISGLEVLKIIKNETRLKSIPIIILTSSHSTQDVVNCYKNYANCYIKKASNLEELYEITDKIEQFWFNQVILPDPDNNRAQGE